MSGTVFPDELGARQSTECGTAPSRSVATYRRFVRGRPPRERCDLCGVTLIAEHQHLVEVAIRRLVCACDACALLFPGQDSAKYRRVPRRILRLPDFSLTNTQWDSLLIPIGMAFFFRSSPAGRVIAL